jgi:O-antigen/teichoic acid export membrane protein
MLKSNIKLVFSTNALMLSSGVVTSLLSAWALGPAGRGDLIIVLMWPAIFSMCAQFGLPSAYRFWTAKRPECVSALFSNAVIFTLIIGLIALAIAELVIPYLIGTRSPEVLHLVRMYLLVIPVLMLTDLTRGLLEGARRFKWVGVLRLILFGVQVSSYIFLWVTGRLTVASATYTMIVSVIASLLLSLVAVWVELKPNWKPRFADLNMTLHYGIRDYPGVLTEFINWRLDLMMLVGIASSSAVGLYAVALRLADITSILASSVGDALMPEVASSDEAEKGTRLLTRSLRLTLFVHLIILIPLWIASPHILRFAYGESFVPVTNVMRMLMFASVMWSSGAVVISGLNGLGRPGLSAVARITSALVMVISLAVWLPTRGIQGAALASIAGYTAMFVAALIALMRLRRLSLVECLKPRWDDLPQNLRWPAVQMRILRLLHRSPPADTPSKEALVNGLE